MRKAINNRPYIGERGALIVLVLLNSALQLAGYDVLPFTENDVETFLTVVFNFVAMDAVYWKNNSLTEESEAGGKIHEGEKPVKDNEDCPTSFRYYVRKCQFISESLALIRMEDSRLPQNYFT